MWSPGQSGNPKGRAQEKPFKDALRLAINECQGDTKKLRKVAEALVEAAMKGDVTAIKEVADRLDGKPEQTQNVNIRDATLADALGQLVVGRAAAVEDEPTGLRHASPEGHA